MKLPNSEFNKANKKIHKVEDQWHYSIMKKYGWLADTLTGVGFVRTYKYYHPNIPNKIAVSTGYSADYWRDTSLKNVIGYWRDLEPYLKGVNNDKKRC